MRTHNLLEIGYFLADRGIHSVFCFLIKGFVLRVKQLQSREKIKVFKMCVFFHDFKLSMIHHHAKCFLSINATPSFVRLEKKVLYKLLNVWKRKENIVLSLQELEMKQKNNKTKKQRGRDHEIGAMINWNRFLDPRTSRKNDGKW